MDYRIEELATAANATVRNIRAYQERGLLPLPRRQGRVAWYSDEHLARLRVIGTLLERGYSLANIAELLGTWEAGSDLRDVLGLEAALMTPFSDEASTPITVEELAALFGTLDPIAIAKAVEVGLLTIDGARLRTPSLRVLRVAAELHRAGVPLDALLSEVARLMADVDRIAERFVRLIEEHVFDVYPHGRPPPKDTAKLTELISRLRPMSKLVVDVALAQGLERHVKARLGARFGRALAPGAKAKRAKTGAKKRAR